MALWTKEEEQKLIKIFYTTEKEQLEKIFNRNYRALYEKHLILTGHTVAPRKKIAKLERCPNCNNLINKIPGEGYFCKYCLKEFNRYGEFIPPLSANG